MIFIAYFATKVGVAAYIKDCVLRSVVTTYIHGEVKGPSLLVP